jgi:hypothetical protein
MRLRPSEDLAAAFAPVRRPASPEATGTDRGGTRARPYPPLPTSGAVATGRLQLCRRLLSLCSRPTIGTSSRLFCRMLFSGNASCREERPRSVSNDPHPVPRAGEEKTSPGLATHEDKIPLKESGSRLPPGCLPTPNEAAATSSGSYSVAPPDVINHYKSAPMSSGMRKIRAYPARKPLRNSGKRK